MRWLLAPLALLAAPTAAQVAVPRPLSAATVATKADVQAATATADAARAAAEAACRATPLIPPAEMIGGTAGTAGTSCRPTDAAQPRITRAAMVQTNGSGTWSVTWSAPLAAAPMTLPIPINATAEPVVCNVATTTAAGATGRCWYARTLPSTLISLTALINFDLFGAPADAISVQVLAIPPTQ